MGGLIWMMPEFEYSMPRPSANKGGNAMSYREHFVLLDQHRIYAREYLGEEPAIIMMHGFPDNVHLYDRLVPYLSPRRLVVFDFLGWGASDKPRKYSYTLF